MTMEEWEENRCPYCTADYGISKNCSVNRISIPNGATNGDAIKMLFYVKDVKELECCTFVSIAGDADMRVYKDWWNAPYKKGDN